MNTRTNIIIAAATLLLSSTLMSGNAAAYNGTLCKTIHIGAEGSSAGGIAKFRNRRAKRRAISAWEDIAKMYGPSHGDFDNATVTYTKWSQTSRGNPKYIVKASIYVCI